MAKLRTTTTTCLLTLALAIGCTSAQVTKQYGGDDIPKPDRILVYDFAAAPGEVKLDRGLSAKVIEAAKSGSPSDQELELGHKVANLLAKHLVDQLNKLDLSAQRASGPHPVSGNSLLIEGQLVSIDQGNRTERVTIGLGLGRSDVQTHVQVLLAREENDQELEILDVTAQGSRKPGAVETLGVGAAAGHLVVSAAVTAGGTAADETLGGTVEADAERTAKKIVKELEPFFKRQGWIEDD